MRTAGAFGADTTVPSAVTFKETKSGMWYVKKSSSIVGKFNTEQEAKNEAKILKTTFPRNAVNYYQDSNLKAYLNG